MADTPIYNLTGALIFSAYVISALVLTILICGSLISQYKRLRETGEGSKRTIDVEKRLEILSALSVLSFSTLSYNMLSYLIVSYQSWAQSHSVPLPRQFLGDGGLLGAGDESVQLHIWKWLTSSTLFQDFAEAICGDSARFWWTQQALLVTMAWSVFMSFEGLVIVLLRLNHASQTTNRAKTQDILSMGIRLHQPDLACFFCPEPVLHSDSAEACLKAKRKDMDTHSNNSTSATSGVLHLRFSSAIRRRYRGVHGNCHIHPTVARWSLDLAFDCS